MLIFDQRSFEATARVVSAANPYRRGQDVESLVADMKDVARQHFFCDPSCVGTGGFYLTAIHPRWDRDNLWIKATVDATILGDEILLPLKGVA